MADPAIPLLSSETPAAAAASQEATNARMLNETVGKLIEAGGSNSADIIAALNTIATAVTNSLIGGTTGANANRVLVSKGTGGIALQPTQVTLDPAAAGFSVSAILFAAAQRVLGRNTSGAGLGEEVTATQILDWIGATQGAVLYRAASDWTALAPGTAGQFLQTQGAAANPQWAAAAGGSTLIKTLTASNSATIDFVNGVNGVVLDNTYDAYQVKLSSIKPANDGVGLWLRVGTGATPTWEAGATAYGWNTYDLSGAGTIADTSDSEIELVTANAASGLGNGTGKALNGTVEFSDPASANFPGFHFRTVHKSAANATGGNVGIGLFLTASAITGLRFLCSGGNIASGVFSLYGFAK